VLEITEQSHTKRHNDTAGTHTEGRHAGRIYNRNSL
jgi:hypothetical protein